MQIRLKLSNEISRELGISEYVICKEFHFASALLHAVSLEGEKDAYDYPEDLESCLSEAVPPSPLSSRSPSPSPPPQIPPIRLPGVSQKETPQNSRKRHAKEQSKAARKRRRQECGPKTADAIPVRSSVQQAHIAPAIPIPASFSLSTDARVASTGWVGVRAPDLDAQGKEWSLQELVGPRSKFQFELIKWDGTKTVPLVDEELRVFGLLVGTGDDLKKCAEEAAHKMEQMRKSCRVTTKLRNNRRGGFLALSSGIFFGTGMVEPLNICHNKANAKVLASFTHPDLADSDPNKNVFQRLSGFTTGVFKTWAPHLYNYYAEHLDRLLQSDSHLTRPFNNSVFAAAAFNMGPRTVCHPHIDHNNLAFGWCPIWALAKKNKYDYTKGGHLILWDLKLVIEFPPGALVIIPSGVLRHSNTRIAPHERRYSFTQYSAGGLFRWVTFGFQTYKDFRERCTAAQAAQEEKEKRARWEKGLNLYPTLKDLGLA